MPLSTNIVIRIPAVGGRIVLEPVDYDPTRMSHGWTHDPRFLRAANRLDGSIELVALKRGSTVVTLTTFPHDTLIRHSGSALIVIGDDPPAQLRQRPAPLLTLEAASWAPAGSPASLALFAAPLGP
jgi:hypothetical protein